MKQYLNLLILTCAAATFLCGDYALCREYATYENYNAYEEGGLYTHECKRLASAPIIVIGKIVAIKHAGVDKLGARIDTKIINPRDRTVDVYEVSVSIESTIKGAIADREIIVEALLVPFEERLPVELQVLATNKRFVFFLARRKGSKVWKGVSPFEFALRVEATPAWSDQKKWSAADLLRLTAKANIRKADEQCAAKWFMFLRQQYNKKEKDDSKFCLKCVDDPRLLIRGEALVILCKHHPKTAGLYGKALKFVDETESKPVSGMVRSRVIDHLLNPLDHLKPELRNLAIKTLLLKNNKWLTEVTLTVIKDKQYSDLEPVVVNFMMKTKDRNLQYHCIKTLYALRKRNYPAMHIFMKSPESYIDEFKEQTATGVNRGRPKVRERNHQRKMPESFEAVYRDWKSVEARYRHYSKTEPLKKLPEYKAFLTLGENAIPNLEEKVRLDDGMDFVLCDIIIQLSNWNPEEFDVGDLGKRCQQVLEKLEDKAP